MPKTILIRRPNIARVHDAAVLFVAAELSRRNLKVEQLFRDLGSDLEIERTGKLPTLVRVKGKTSTEWQTPYDLAPLKGGSQHLVVFVDLDPRTAGVPAYWIAPERWVLADIKRHHRASLDRHGGKRPRSPKSKHHAIAPERLMKWRDRWDLFLS